MEHSCLRACGHGSEASATGICADVDSYWHCLVCQRKPSPLRFSSWKVKLATTAAQRQLCDYILSTWIDSSTWPPSSWSVFKRSVRSNKDVEGWHRRLNQIASRGQLNMYLLLQLIGTETELLEVQLTLLKESSHIRRQRESSRRVTSRLFAAWDRLAARQRTVRQTLRAAAYLLPKH